MREVADLPSADLLALARDTSLVQRQSEVELLHVAYQWAITHPALDSVATTVGPVLPGVLDADETLGGAGTPSVAAFTPEPLATALEISSDAATSLLADSLDLHHRLPRLLDQVTALLVPVWKARRVAAATRALSYEGARWVDGQLGGRVGSLGAAGIDRLVADAAARFDPDHVADRVARERATWDVWLDHGRADQWAGTSLLHARGDTLDLTRFHELVCAEAETLAALGNEGSLGVRKATALGVIAAQQASLDLTELLPTNQPAQSANHADLRSDALDKRVAKIKLYLHASLTDVLALAQGDDVDGSVRVERLGSMTLRSIRDWVGHSRVTITPVLDPHGVTAAGRERAVDSHDPPPRMAEAVRLRDPHCVFPWCNHTSRAADLDHIEPYVPPDNGGPPGQTQPGNLAPLCRRHHRAKTAKRWSYRRTDDGDYWWTSPHEHLFLVTPHGTLAL